MARQSPSRNRNGAARRRGTSGAREQPFRFKKEREAFVDETVEAFAGLMD